MPEPTAVDVEARIEAALQARRPVLEQLVREAADRELVAIVEPELAAAAERLAKLRAKGTPPAPPSRPSSKKHSRRHIP